MPRPGSPARSLKPLALLLGAGVLLGALVQPPAFGKWRRLSSLRAPGSGNTQAGKPAPRSAEDWPNVGNDKGGMRYSPLRQINRENVKDLQVAWTYHTGAARVRGNIQCTPVVVDGVMYLTNDRIQVVALDAATGRELWKHDAHAGGVNRGVAYWSDGKPEGARRVFLGTEDGRLISLDARTGLPDPTFGREGTLDLREGMEGDLKRTPYGASSAPMVWEDRVILGFHVSEGPRPGAPGDLRAFDVRTGKQVWRFHTVPRPGEFGHDTWPADGWQERSGVNNWGGMTVDAERGIVFCGTGSAAYDWYGGDRAGDNLFANCTLAIDARSGQRLWHYQVVRHDLWDYDLPCPPVLVKVRHDGKLREAAAQVSKSGYCYLFDRLTGKPLFPVLDRPVPQSDVPGEHTAATQPIPVKPPPLAPLRITEADITDISSEAHAEALARFRQLRHEGPFTPPSLKGSLAVPGFHGGATWSGASFDPTSGLLYVNTNNTPVVLALRQEGPGSDYRLFGSQSGRSHTGRGLDVYYFNDKDGYPGIKPPWGTLIAIDLNKGELAWRVPLGEYPELKAKGIPPTGTENFGGTIVTAGGLVFLGAAQDEMLHAFDKRSGQLLWQHPLGAGGYATPCTYMVNGRQYVVIAAGGSGKIGSRPGDAFLAFALPSAAAK